MTDSSHLIFVTQILLFLHDRAGKTVQRTVDNMQDLANVRAEIRSGKLKPGLGDLTVDQQLWFALAKHAEFIRDVSTPRVRTPSETKID